MKKSLVFAIAVILAMAFNAKASGSEIKSSPAEETTTAQQPSYKPPMHFGLKISKPSIVISNESAKVVYTVTGRVSSNPTLYIAKDIQGNWEMRRESLAVWNRSRVGFKTGTTIYGPGRYMVRLVLDEYTSFEKVDQAYQVWIDGFKPSCTPTPIPTKTPAPSPTPSLTPKPTETPTLTPSPTPSPTTTPTETPTLTPSPTPTLTPSPTPALAILNVVKNSVPVNHAVIAGSMNTLIGSWNFDAAQSGDDLTIAEITVAPIKTDGSVASFVLVNGTEVIPSADSTSTATFSTSREIVRGTATNFDLRAEIRSNASDGSVEAWAVVAVKAYSKSTGEPAEITGLPTGAAEITVVPHGELTVNTDSASLPDRLVVAGTNGVAMNELRCRASDEDADIFRIGLGINGYDQISKAYLRLDGTTIGNADGYAISGPNKTIQLNRGELHIPRGDAGKRLSILADFVQIGTNQPGISGAEVSICIESLEVIGCGSNMMIEPTIIGPLCGSTVVVREIIPIVNFNGANGSKLGVVNTLPFDITGCGNGQLDLLRMRFRFYTSTETPVCCPQLIDLNTGRLINTAGSMEDNSVQFIILDTVSINANQTRTLGLRWQNTLTTGDDIVAIQICGDDFNANSPNFVWADQGQFLANGWGVPYLWSVVTISK